MGEMEVKRENERKEMRVWSNSKFLGNSVQQKTIRNYYPEILQSTKVQLVKSLAAITFVRLRYSRSQLERLIVQRLILKELSVRPNSECLGNNSSVQQKMIRNCHSGILYGKLVNLAKSFAAINFVRSQYSRSQSMEHLREISQKPRMRPFEADSL